MALTVLVLLLVAWSQGAYSLRYWGPLAVFVLVSVAAAGGARPVRGIVLAIVGLAWAFAGWSLLSALWADSAGRAVEGGMRNVLYAALLTLPIVSLPDRRVALRLGASLVVGISLVVVVTYIAALVDGPGLFLAGRLDDPVGYRNGTAALFALAFWPLLCVAAVRHRHFLLRSSAMALAILALGLAFLSQSRGVLFGFLVGGAVAVLLGPDRVRRTWLALLAGLALAVAAGALLTPYDAFVDRRTVTADEIATAVHTLGFVAVATFVVVCLAALLDGGLRLSAPAMRRARQVSLGALLLVGVVIAAGALAKVGNPVQYASDKYEEFKAPEQRAGRATRLGSTGGPRAELWRVALEEFGERPVAGVGQGNYPLRYYEIRRTNRNVTDPHSLPMAVLAETGIIGGLLFAGLLIAVAVALARRVRGLDTDARRWVSALAAAAAVVVAQSAVDWLWLIPGLAGLALLCAGLAVTIATAPEEAERLAAPRPRWRRIVLVVVPAVMAIVAAALSLSDFDVRQARAATTPAERIEEARSAERLNPLALTPHYLEAGGLEALGRRAEARAALRDALEIEPGNFVTLTLLGDLEFRAGKREAARRLYRRALERNPGDIGLQKLAEG